MFQVRARAYVEGERFVDELILPCAAGALADPDALVDGSALSPGDYGLQLRGIDRAGEPWQAADGQTEPDPDVTGCTEDFDACLPTELVCGCMPLTVTADELVDLPEYVLVPPPECDDGIDNDRDGVVDDRDPSCAVDGGVAGEGIPVGLTELRLELTLLGQNPNATCGSVPLRSLRVELQGDGADTILLDEPCELERPYLLSLRIPAGRYTFVVTGLDSDGAEVVVPKSFDAVINATGGSILQAIDFAPEDFLEPIVARMSIGPQYVSTLGLDTGGALVAPRGTCEAASAPGTLDIPSLQLELLNAHGGPLTSPVILDGTPVDGRERPCDAQYLTEPTEWGGYTLIADAVSADGEVCFTNRDHPDSMRPSETLGVPLTRVYDEAGQVPASCRECETDDDCDPDEPDWACLDGVCQRPCDLDRDCESLVLGELGFECLEVEGYERSYCRLELE